jgi:tetratricopeptide (TPR) repeat protein
MTRRAIALGLLLATATAPSPALATSQQQDPRTVLLAAVDAARANDCNTALKIVAKQTAMPSFLSFADEIRAAFYQLGIACSAQQGQMDLALRYADEGVKIKGAPAEFWPARFKLQWQTGRIADAVTTLEAMARDNPEALNAFEVRAWYTANRSLQELNKPALRQRLLKVIASPGYVPDEIGETTDEFRQEYAAMLAEGGDQVGAAATVALIDDPKILLNISVDTQLRSMIPANFDARAAVEHHMARMREIAAAHPRMILPQRNVAEDLLMLGKGEEALATLAAIQPDKASDGSYADKAEQLNWWWDTKALAYALLGRYDEAVSAYAKGESVAEHGQSINQTLNMAGLQLRFGHYADALSTVAPVAAGRTNANPRGWMIFHWVHGCASFKAGKLEDAKKDLAYMRDHVADVPAVLTGLQLCMGDLDGAAASIIRRLDTPDQRVGALLELSDYEPGPPTFPQDPAEAAFPALAARADVLAAAARAGGTRKFNIPQ